MARLQSFKRLIAEDFPEKDRPLIQKIAYVVNIFGEDVLNALNKQLTIEDNLNIVKKDITVVVDGSGEPTIPISIKTNLDHACQGITVIKVSNVTDPTSFPSGTPFVSFSENSGTISISNITNLTAADQYQLRLILF
jgi:uncharacterized membrane protein